MTLQQKRELYNYLILENRIRMPDKMKAINNPSRYKFIYGGRGGAKSVSVAKKLLEMGTKRKIRVLCGREIQNSIKDSVHSSLKDLVNELAYDDYKVTENSIYHKRTKSEFIFMGLYRQEIKQTIKSYSNIDYAWIEEAQNVSAGSIKILDPTIRKENSEIWFTFNRLLPDDPVWHFMERIPEDKKTVININYYDNTFLPQVLLDQAIRSKKEYDEGISDDYLHVWLGECVQYSDKIILRLKDILEATNKNISDEGGYAIGVDVARYGKDKTVFFKRKGMKVVDWRVYEKQSLMDTAKELIQFVGRNNTKIPMKIDDTGLGGGVVDYLMKFGYNAIPINFGGRPLDPDKHNNVISEMWFQFKSIVNEVSIPDIQELKSELLTREYYIDNKERLCVESKDQYKKRYHKSPDYADALLLCYYNQEDEVGYLIDGII
jgi:phage terminase large subunit